MNLIGLVVVRNHISLDYCPVEAALSLAPVCHTVIVSDMESDDGSYADLQEKLNGYSNILVETQPWEKPHNDPQWWVKALNYARRKFVAKGEMFLQLDADEVIGPESHEAIKEGLNNPLGGLMFKRYTFWKDHRHLVPHNRCCGEMVARMGPGHMYLPSDEPIPAERPNIREVAEEHPKLHIYHYGMIREPKKFLAKSDVVQNAFFGSVDSRLTAAKDHSTAWYDVRDYFDGEPLRVFEGKHPEIIKPWLKQRGFDA